jgi:nucleotide-binding universal stress UspA family protein
MAKNILVPHDFTSFGDIAFKKALEIAKKFNSKLTLLTVIGSDIDTSGMNLERAQQAFDDDENKAKNFLNQRKDTAQIENVDIYVEIVHNSSVVDGILFFAEKNDIDLIVIGSHGRSGFKKLVLGSVASEVVTKAKCPVLVTKDSR